MGFLTQAAQEGAGEKEIFYMFDGALSLMLEHTQRRTAEERMADIRERREDLKQALEVIKNREYRRAV